MGMPFFRHIYAKGHLNIASPPPFENNRAFAEQLEREVPLNLPEIRKTQQEEGTKKFTLDLDRSINCETVLIPMKEYSTLCLSSQLGCRWNCRFCETGRLGYARNLTTAEIMAQILTARFILKADNLRNLVFMGMGEPLENMDALMESINIGLRSPGTEFSRQTYFYLDCRVCPGNQNPDRTLPPVSGEAL